MDEEKDLITMLRECYESALANQAIDLAVEIALKIHEIGS